MRTASKSLSLPASGSVALTGSHGHEYTGTIRLAVAGPRRCKITLTVGPPVLRETVTAVVNGARGHIAGPAGLLRAAPLAAAWRSPERQRADPAGNRSPHSKRPTGATRAKSGEPLPVSPQTGCALLLAAPVSGSATASLRGQAATLSYSGAMTAAGLSLPGAVTEAISGKTRLTIRFTSIAAHDFAPATFALPPPKGAAAAPQAGGAQ